MGSMTRRMFVILPFLHRFLTSTPASTPDGTPPPSASGAGSHLPGVDGPSYTSPLFPWSMTFDDTLWQVTESTSGNDEDSLTLQGTAEGAPSAIVTFQTSKLQGDDAGFRLLQAAAALDNAFPDATLEIASSTQSGDLVLGNAPLDAGYGFPGQHSIAAFVARHRSGPSRDRIIEMDGIEVTESDGVLVITASSSPGEYHDSAFDLVEELRWAITMQGRSPTPGLGGGSRPRVQY